ncbi:gluconokinase [Catenulispora pinisilvae]|uniref:gluconokinase n=1 Tax=Catenulispora pinisilvae TaxID=2705253 RepID=UPI001890B9C7|nr:gluconokinase [Catenulispora pinisilvae]
MNAEPNPAAGAVRGAEPPILLITGVSGSGKTTIGSLLAGRLGWEYAEADTFHPAANIAKMSAGHPLTDEDRGPWLDNIGQWIDETTAKGRPGVVTSSALKRAYRDRLLKGRPQVRLIYLDAARETVARRLTARNGHFFPPELLDSQFGDLEPPADDEHPVRVKVDDHDSPLTVAEQLIHTEKLDAVEAAHDAEAAHSAPANKAEATHSAPAHDAQAKPADKEAGE